MQYHVGGYGSSIAEPSGHVRAGGKRDGCVIRARLHMLAFYVGQNRSPRGFHVHARAGFDVTDHLLHFA